MLFSLYGVGPFFIFLFIIIHTFFHMWYDPVMLFSLCSVGDSYLIFLSLYYYNTFSLSWYGTIQWCHSVCMVLESFSFFYIFKMLYMLIFSAMIHWHWNFLIARAKSWQEEHKSFTERKPNKVYVFISDFLCNLPFLLLVLWWYLSACLLLFLIFFSTWPNK